MILNKLSSAALMAGMLICPTLAASGGTQATPTQAREIAKEAYVYGFPMVDGYRITHAYFLNPENPEFKAPLNTLRNIARVFTSEDRAVQTPNSDTPYSLLGMDLRTEPLVLSVPAIEKQRYFSIQLIDAYTFNFAYIGSRTTGNDGGNYLIAGPSWKGKAPAGINKVIRSETNLAMALYRTQLFNPADLENVKKVQAGYKVQPLSAFLGLPAPKAAPKFAFVQPQTPDGQKTNLEFFNVLNFVLRFCPTHPSEKDLMVRFARIGIGAGKKIDVAKLSPEMKTAMAEGMADAWKELEDLNKTSIATGKLTTGDMFGTREFLKNNYLYRFTGAVLGIYGNSAQEAMYPIYQVDSDGQKLDAANSSYVLRFAPGQLPPANAFWSLTMYELPASLLTANPLNRYLINSPMLPALKRDADGGLTLYIQSETPGQDKESNWLPAPKGPFMAVIRLYWPKEEVLNRTWKQPPMMKVQ